MVFIQLIQWYFIFIHSHLRKRIVISVLRLFDVYFELTRFAHLKQMTLIYDGCD